MSRKILLLFFLILSFSIKPSCQNLDINILREINLNRNRSLDGTFVTITNSLKLVTTAVPVGMVGIALIKRDTNMIRSVLVMGASSLVQGLITKNLKRIVARPRPFVTYPQIENFDDPREKSIPISYNTGDFESFPSGHASGAFAFATSLSLEYPKWYVIAPSFAWASAVGYSRMDMGVHYPSDILMGAAVGAGSAWFCHYLNKKLFRNHKIFPWEKKSKTFVPLQSK